MSQISRDEVAHLARLARLALTDAELGHFAAQLDVIISAVARVQEVTADGIPPASHAAVPGGRSYAAAGVGLRRLGRPGLASSRSWSLR